MALPPPLTPEERLAEAAKEYAPSDSEALALAVLRRREYRLSRSGRACDTCAQTKPVSAFSRDSREKDGLRRYCRECAAERYQERARVNAR